MYPPLLDTCVFFFLFFFFFFFQAEDGIRDIGVTGVQTCALPIWFRSSLIHSPLPILLFDDGEEILAISQSWLEGSGYSREELRRIEDWATRAYGSRSGNVLEQIRKVIWTEPEAHASEGMIRTKDGRERFWSIVISAL